MQLKLKTLMKAADSVTVKKGVLQTVAGPIACQSYVPQFENKIFAVDAKALIEAFSSLEDDFKVFVKGNKVLLVDSMQEVLLYMKPADILIKIPEDPWVSEDFASPFNIVRNFSNIDYPGVFIDNNLMYAVTSESIVRIPFKHDIQNMVLPNTRIPTKVSKYLLTNNKAFIVYEDDVLIMSRLRVDPPHAHHLFDKVDQTKLTAIPNHIRELLINCDTVQFKDSSLILMQQETAEVTIEEVTGAGEYSYPFFNKLVKLCDRWLFLDDFLFFFDEKTGLQGILENIQQPEDEIPF